MTAFQNALKGAPPNSVLIYVRLYNDLLATYDRATKIQTIHSRLVSSLRILNTTLSSTQQLFKRISFFQLRLHPPLEQFSVGALGKPSRQRRQLVGHLVGRSKFEQSKKI